MSFSLTANFLANARGLTFADGSGINWALNPNTNVITASYTGSGSSGAANPSAKIGPVVVNGTAATFMRSDAAPPIDLTASYAWTGSHTFTKTVVISGTGGTLMTVSDATVAVHRLISGLVTADFLATPTGGVVRTTSNDPFSIATSGIIAATFDTSQKATFVSAIGWNGATPPAQVTGFGSPTGASVVTNFSGTAATTAQIQATIAQILTIMKAHGMIGA